MTEIKIKIDCKKTTCGDCNRKNYNMMSGAFCPIFKKSLKVKNNIFSRLPECKKAEVKA